MRQPLDLAELVQELELSDDDAQVLVDRLEARGIELSDDCGRRLPEPVRYDNAELATITVTRCSCSCATSAGTRC